MHPETHGRPNRAVFVDRDGVINRAVVRSGKPYPPESREELEILSGVPEAVERLRRAGLLVIVATNQPDVATGKQEKSVVEAMHNQLREALRIDDIKVCYHADDDGCACRKPKPGMLVEAAGEWSIDLSRSYMVGDRWRDIEAGRAAGCRTFWIDYGYAEKPAENADAIVASLVEATDIIVAEVSERRAI